jgi:regulation of enolase protein 1 (concanavalin A-like superfamily)
MTHSTYSKLVIVVSALWCSAGLSGSLPAQELKSWGLKVDPNRDCQFALDGDRLTINIPAIKHNLCVEVGEMNAPRVLREIEGDFIAQIKVSGNVGHQGSSTSRQFLGYHGAGLLLWQDERNYIRLERAAIAREGGGVHYGNFELRKDGQLASSQPVKLPEHDITLRVERRDGQVLGAVSTDGIHWHYFDPIAIRLPRRVRLGVAAINTSTERFKATFTGREIFKKETN